MNDFLLSTWSLLFAYISATAFLWVPAALAVIFWKLWILYIQGLYVKKLNTKLLHIKVPREVHKSPAAMEMFFISLYQTGGVSQWFKRYWQGRVRMSFSLEIASVEGRVYFFVRVPEVYLELVKSYMYSQYPSVEISEVDDYTRYVPEYMKDNEWGIHGAEFSLAKEDVYPIKTYIDYGMDKDLGMKQEQRLDPMAPLIEYMGSIGPGEQVWFQILIQGATNKHKVPGSWFKRETWDKQGARILKEDLMGKDFALDTDGDGNPVFNAMRLSQSQKDVLTAVERSLSKKGFDSIIRWMYLGRGNSFNGRRIPQLYTILQQFSSGDLNGFKPSYNTDFDFMYEDVLDIALEKRNREMFKNYVNRAGFTHPNKRKTMTLTTEELATIFHLPSSAVETPSFERVDSLKAEPPQNLPM